MKKSISVCETKINLLIYYDPRKSNVISRDRKVFRLQYLITQVAPLEEDDKSSSTVAQARQKRKNINFVENVDRILYTLDLAVKKRGRVMKHDLDKVSQHAKAPYSDQLIVKLLAYSIIPQSTHPQLKIHSFIKKYFIHHT